MARPPGPLSRRTFLGLTGGSLAAAGLAGCGPFGGDDGREASQPSATAPVGAGLGGATITVLRRMEIDIDRFLAASVAEQEAVIGRRRATAAPLSGGTIATDPDLDARTPAGEFLIPAHSHVRRAHPPSTGVPTMLRRSYSFVDTAAGAFFVSFQNDLSTFVRTLNRMSTADDLLDFTTTTRSATFLVLPAFDASQPLGASLFER